MPVREGGADAAAVAAGGPDLDAAARALAGTAESGGAESMSVEEIVAAYYNALSVRAHAEADRAAGSAASAGTAADAALEAFDRRFHPRALACLESMAAGLAERLERDGEDGEGEDGGEGGEFDRLRAAMSAAEFARQYDRGLRRG